MSDANAARYTIKTLFKSQKAQDAFVVMGATADFAHVSPGDELASTICARLLAPSCGLFCGASGPSDC